MSWVTKKTSSYDSCSQICRIITKELKSNKNLSFLSSSCRVFLFVFQHFIKKHQTAKHSKVCCYRFFKSLFSCKGHFKENRTVNIFEKKGEKTFLRKRKYFFRILLKEMRGKKGQNSRPGEMKAKKVVLDFIQKVTNFICF